MPARLVTWGIQHRTTGSWLSVEGHPIPSVEGARTFTTFDRADTYRKRYLDSFAESWKVSPIPQPEGSKVAA